jgi:hypothetical protein
MSDLGTLIESALKAEKAGFSTFGMPNHFMIPIGAGQQHHRDPGDFAASMRASARAS